ncbi:hypothetical protein [Alteromonas sp. R78001]|uniref:hypothetical protein n=1 Tax=Alteromonas sp. R78001 TaxID=3093865 RepID=UPI00366CEB12
MLFPLDPNTPRSKIFEKLNAELLFFLQASVTKSRFSRQLFSNDIGLECWNNAPTKKKFKDVWEQLPSTQADKQAFFNIVNNSQDVSLLFVDKTSAIPRVEPPDLFAALKSLTTHLFTRTKKLAGIIRIATESIEDHYQEYVRLNKELCFLCGTAALSHNRFNVDDADQWVSDYDHLLCKDKYPTFSCHPDNFIPTCHICNSKAKGAKDALYNGIARRKAFYPLPPLMQSFYHKVRLKPVFAQLADYATDGDSNPLRAAQITYVNATPDENEMIKAWVDLYQVPKRVSERIVSNFCEVVSSDCRPTNFSDFCAQVARQATRQPLDMKTTEWRFWWFRLYEWLHAQTVDIKRDAWALIEWKQQQVNNDNNAFQTYGI